MQKNNFQITIVGGIMLILFYLTWCVLTKSYGNTSFFVGAVICLAGVLVCYLYLQWKLFANDVMSSQLHGINISILAVFFLVLIRNAMNCQLIWLEVLISILIVVATALFEVLWIRRTGVEEYKKRILNILKKISRNREIILVLIFFCILSVHTGGTAYKWDSGLYYDTCQDIKLFSISSQAIYGHIAQTFGFLMKIGTIICGDVSRTAQFMNVFLACVSILAFYGILCCVFPQKNRKECVLGSAIYAFCPFVLGLVNYLSLDYYCGILFPVLIYVTLSEKWLYHFVVAFAFCFTKEPAIVIYAIFCVAILIFNEISKHKKFKTITFKSVVGHYQYWYMVLIGCMWVTTYVLLGPWNAGEGGFIVNGEYIISKLKVLYIFNFHWLFTVLALGGIIVIARNGNKKLKELCGLIILPQMAFTLFSCVFKTVNHYRYTDITLFILILMSVIFLLSLRSARYVKLGVMMCLIISLTASYVSVDPLSRMLFTTVSTGNGRMFSTGEEKTFGDMTIYNKQMLGMENMLNLALSDAVEENNIILFNMQQENPWYFDGMSDFGKSNGLYSKTSCYWNAEAKQRCRINMEGTTALDIYHVSNGENLEKVIQKFPEGTIFSYIGIDEENDEIIKIIHEQYSEVSDYKYDYFNWGLKRVCFAVGM